MLTKEQKIELYEKALLNFMEEDPNRHIKFLCNTIGEVAKELGHLEERVWMSSSSLTMWFKTILPEFYACKPHGVQADHPWWPCGNHDDMKQRAYFKTFRAGVLKQIIKDLHNEDTIQN